MNGKQLLFFLFFGALLFSTTACKKVTFEEPIDQPDPGTGGVDTTETVELVDWSILDIRAERKIQNTLGTPFELYAITDNQFFRYDLDLELVEKRPLDASQSVYSRPVLNDNTFVRLTRNEDEREIIEFHLTRSPLQIEEFVVNELGSDTEFFQLDFFSVYPGAFSDDGVYFLLPTKNLRSNHYTCFLFELRHTPNHNAFTSIEVIDRIEMEQLGLDIDNLENVRFLNGSFYLASKEGGFRIGLNGAVEQVLPQWIVDFFETNSGIYATGFNDFDFYNSTNNGRSWQKVTGDTSLKIVETKGERIFSQDVLGRPFQLAMDDLLESKAIYYNEDFTTDPTSYVNVDFFAERYFISIHKELFYVEDIQLNP
ncbi:MAG: hypothetical protein AB8G22_05175 [Saprospiraceae bacterium]